MLKNEIDVLVIAHNICIAFDYVPVKKQDFYLHQLRMIEKEICNMANHERRKED